MRRAPGRIRLRASAPLPPLGIEPRRRTIVVVDTPAGHRSERWPMALDIGESFYIKPESGRLLFRRRTRTPARLATRSRMSWMSRWPWIASKRTNHTGSPVGANKWAGLRSFAPDGVPVVGDHPVRRIFSGWPGKAGTVFKPLRRWRD